MNCKEKSNALITIGHRGAMGHETENTLASIQKALDLNVDMIEIDVFKIASGEIVVFHDEKIDRITDGSGGIESLDLVALKNLTVEGNHKIPLLSEVLDVINHKVPLNIELKGPGTSEGVMNLIKTYMENEGWTLDDFLISSFNWEELKNMRRINKDIKIAILTEDDPLDAIPIANDLNAVAINPNYLSLTRENVQEIKSQGFKVFTWTVNDTEQISKLRELGVDGVFTNYPERVN
ncbi:glycerophosphodiester phosphodiesterase [uncultured Eudoraea sp.]|uniref:glycerophosphodiester phosphodiesterase n=1 Tax=uncultured Eudoraea sp. TaxID=1035614 RepID=UPI002633717A|nr:glycerophosphodiester phosphodiesterase [uncultured Eudoraea sp.]